MEFRPEIRSIKLPAESATRLRKRFYAVALWGFVLQLAVFGIAYIYTAGKFFDSLPVRVQIPLFTSTGLLCAVLCLESLRSMLPETDSWTDKKHFRILAAVWAFLIVCTAIMIWGTKA
jgi:hypothetical protein